MNWSRDKVKPKLKGSGHGENRFNIGLIGTKYFESKQKLNSLYLDESKISGDCNSKESESPVKKEKITLEEAFEFFQKTTISCNINYYLENREEMRKDSEKKFDNLDIFIFLVFVFLSTSSGYPSTVIKTAVKSI